MGDGTGVIVGDAVASAADGDALALEPGVAAAATTEQARQEEQGQRRDRQGAAPTGRSAGCPAGTPGS